MRWSTCGTILWTVALLSVGLPSIGGAEGDPPHYRRRATWQETILASTSAIIDRGLEEPFGALESETLRGGDPPRRLCVELAGAREIFLFVTGVPDPIWGVGTWGDARLVTADVASYAPNVWGLHDMHGNAAEWTRSDERPGGSGGAEPSSGPSLLDTPLLEPPPLEHAPVRKVVRGGSWRDRPLRATSSFRLAYPPYQRVFNVGFRVVVEDRPPVAPR